MATNRDGNLGFFRRLFANTVKNVNLNPLDAISFHGDGISFGKNMPNQRIWRTAEGDAIALCYFPNPPDLPFGASNAAEIRTFYDQVATNAQARVVEVAIQTLDECRTVRTVMKLPQKPSGMTYIGSLTLPFRDFSFVLKIQCIERGMTGGREAALYIKFLHERKIEIVDDKVKGELNYDDPQYDDMLPQHPLSRLRRILKAIEPTFKVDARTKSAPGFKLPEN